MKDIEAGRLIDMETWVRRTLRPVLQSEGRIDWKLRLRHIASMPRTAHPDARMLATPEVSVQRPSFFQRLFGHRHARPAAPIVYEAVDIEEDNRISDALRRQHDTR